MNDADLRPRLSALRPPAPSEAAASRALFRATLALAVAPVAQPAASSAPARSTGLFPRLASALAIPALAALLLLPLFLDAPGPVQRSVSTAEAATSRQLLSELEALFPGQIGAVVERDGALELELAESPAPPALADQAVLVEFTRGARRLRLLAYSGRPVRLRLDRQELQFSPLLTGSGQILLAGDDFAWSPATTIIPDALAGWRVTARPLAAVL